MTHNRLVRSACAISRDVCVLINWRVMLLSDGSVTRHLKLLIDGSQIKVRNKKTRDIQVQSTRRGGRKVGSARRVDDHSSNRGAGLVQPAMEVAAAALPHDVVNLIAAQSPRGVVVQREVDLCDANGGRVNLSLRRTTVVTTPHNVSCPFFH